MSYAIGSIVLALMLVLMISLTSQGKNDRRRTNSSSFRHVAAQVDTLKPAATVETAFKVLVFHPASRTDFSELEKSITAISNSAKIESKLEYYAWGKPATTMLARSMKIRVSPESTIVAFVAPNGAITWGGPEEQISSAQASAVFPTMGMCQIIKSAQAGKDMLLVFDRGGAANGEQVIQIATDYVQTPSNNAELFVIDPDDPANSEIVARTKLPPDSLKDTRLLFLTAGQVRGQLSGKFTGEDLKALKKSCSGKAGCC